VKDGAARRFIPGLPKPRVADPLRILQGASNTAHRKQVPAGDCCHTLFIPEYRPIMQFIRRRAANVPALASNPDESRDSRSV
jgi:hypothetical protein